MVKNTEEHTGLGLLLSIVTLLFIIGLIVMIFTLIGGGISDATTEVVGSSVANESLLFTDGAGTDTSVVNLNKVGLSNVIVSGCYFP